MVLASAIPSIRPGDSSAAAARAVSTSATWSPVSSRVIAATFCATHGSTRSSCTSAHSNGSRCRRSRACPAWFRNATTPVSRAMASSAQHSSDAFGVPSPPSCDQPITTPAQRHRPRPSLRILRMQIGPMLQQSQPLHTLPATCSRPRVRRQPAWPSRPDHRVVPSSMDLFNMEHPTQPGAATTASTSSDDAPGQGRGDTRRNQRRRATTSLDHKGPSPPRTASCRQRGLVTVAERPPRPAVGCDATSSTSGGP